MPLLLLISRHLLFIERATAYFVVYFTTTSSLTENKPRMSRSSFINHLALCPYYLAESGIGYIVLMKGKTGFF